MVLLKNMISVLPSYSLNFHHNEKKDQPNPAKLGIQLEISIQIWYNSQDANQTWSQNATKDGLYAKMWKMQVGGFLPDAPM